MGIVTILSSNPGESVQLFSLIFHMWLDGWCCGSLGPVAWMTVMMCVFAQKESLGGSMRSVCIHRAACSLQMAEEWGRPCGDNMWSGRK